MKIRLFSVGFDCILHASGLYFDGIIFLLVLRRLIESIKTMLQKSYHIALCQQSLKFLVYNLL